MALVLELEGWMDGTGPLVYSRLLGLYTKVVSTNVSRMGQKTGGLRDFVLILIGQATLTIVARRGTGIISRWATVPSGGRDGEREVIPTALRLGHRDDTSYPASVIELLAGRPHGEITAGYSCPVFHILRLPLLALESVLPALSAACCKPPPGMRLTPPHATICTPANLCRTRLRRLVPCVVWYRKRLPGKAQQSPGADRRLCRCCHVAESSSSGGAGGGPRNPYS